MKKNASNEVIKNYFNIDRSGALHEKQKEIFNKLLAKRASQFDNVTNLIDPNRLIYMFKNDQRSTTLETIKIPQKLLENLKDGDVNPKKGVKLSKVKLNQV